MLQFLREVMTAVITSSNHEALRENTKGESILKVEVDGLHLGVRAGEGKVRFSQGFGKESELSC